MTAPCVLTATTLTPDAFAPYGEVIGEAGLTGKRINAGSTMRFDTPARIDAGPQGCVAMRIFQALDTIALPYEVTLLERHPLGSQAFMPLTGARFLIVTASPGSVPKVDTLAAFVTDGKQGVNYRRGVWHLPLSSFSLSRYLVIDREGPGENLEEYRFENAILVRAEGERTALSHNATDQVDPQSKNKRVVEI